MKIFFYSTWDIKLYIEVTKNYDMVTNKKSFLSHFFLCHVLLIKKTQKYILIFYPRKIPNSRAHNSLASIPPACKPRFSH